VYAIELVQAILLARMAYLQFAVGFGNYLALDTIPPTFWFGIPILISIGIYHFGLFACRFTYLLEKQ
jgi:hypothetical protein